ncbi:MAG TPA: TlpA family protein disulfide reductase [Kofleriaceae bacterium]|nr:TlpA family protein disulfide reductase [Kofleriaceae bacterium]
MDRLSALIVFAAAAVACSKEPPAEGEPTSRVNGAKVTVKKTDTAAFCDSKPDREKSPPFATPPLADGSTLAPAKTWRWINVWATWCKPCVEEMPRLVKWQGKLGIDVQFISVDESDADIAAFAKLHPGIPPTKRLAKPDAQGAWLAQLGLDAGAPIPVHVFVDPTNHVRCVRAGGVREQDYAAIEALIAGK